MKLFIAVPAYGGKVHAEFTKCLLRLSHILQHKQIQHTIEFLTTESLISRGRNTLVAMFYSDPQYTHLLMLDSDLIFSTNAIASMLMADKEVIGCAYPKKQINYEKVKVLIEDETELQIEGQPLMTDINYNIESPKETEGSIIRAKDVPTGMMLIKRSAISTLMLRFRERQYLNNIAGIPQRMHNFFFDLFGTGVVNGTYLSEDYYFCYLCKECNIECWLETSFTIGHIGGYTYYGNLEKQLEKFGEKDSLNLDKKLLRSYKDAEAEQDKVSQQ